MGIKLDGVKIGINLGEKTWYPTNVELLKIYAYAGFQWAIDSLPEAIRNSELLQCETYWGGCI